MQYILTSLNWNAMHKSSLLASSGVGVGSAAASSMAVSRGGSSGGGSVHNQLTIHAKK